jgi:hypothetical protein
VFLRKGGDRTSLKGKAYKIGAHWCHTKGRDPEHVAGCEMRVSGYTAEDRAKIAAKAKGQRLKVLHRWLWTIFCEHSKSRGGEIPGRFYDQFTEGAHEERLLKDKVSTVLFHAFNKTPQKYLESFVELLTDDIHRAAHNKTTKSRFPYLSGHSGLEKRLQTKISLEVLEFLRAPKQQDILKTLLLHWHYALMAGALQASEYKWDNKNMQNNLAATCDILVINIAQIPWQHHFSKLPKAQPNN